MKSVTHLLSGTAIVMALVATLTAFSDLHAQSGTTQGTRGRNDPIQRELMRRFESDAIERALAGSPRRGPDQDRRLILVQIKEDFLRIQIVDDDLRQATRANLLDLRVVAKGASEITKRAGRLKDNLVLPKSEPAAEKSPDAGETRETQGSNPQVSIEQLRRSLSVLSNSIKAFVENPVFEKAGVVDANLSSRASHDLEQIIEASKQAKRTSEKLMRARPVSNSNTSPPAPPASVSNESRPLPAFPGAEGFGSTTSGGRGGRPIFVTNLNDAGPGSFRAACEADGPRIVIFRVSGLISLASPIVVKNPHLTIAGQTAPGDGICLRNYTFVIATHDVIVRYLRSRLGDLSGQEADSITLASGAANVILDHCSASWSVDEALSLAGNVSNVTVQWCLIAEGLNKSKHTKGLRELLCAQRLECGDPVTAFACGGLTPLPARISSTRAATGRRRTKR